MTDWQSHMKPEEAADVGYRRRVIEAHDHIVKAHYREIRKIAERCRMRARKAKGE